MSNVKVDNNNRNVNVKGNHRNLQNEEDDWDDDDDDLYDDFDQGRWQKGNQRKVLKFKEHKAK